MDQIFIRLMMMMIIIFDALHWLTTKALRKNSFDTLARYKCEWNINLDGLPDLDGPSSEIYSKRYFSENMLYKSEMSKYLGKSRIRFEIFLLNFYLAWIKSIGYSID